MAPDPKACRLLLEDHRVPEHIRRHSAQVARIARRLAEALRLRGEPLDPDLVEAAALTHDIAKADCLDSARDHAREGGTVLRELGYPELGELVERHVELGPWDPAGPVTEAELLNYSDKRVRHEEVVPLDERFEDLLERYGRGNPRAEARIRETWETTVAVEEKIFSRLPFGPNDSDLLS
ncbi:MAG: HD domain-containing protein [Deltaproteobacteria bacterium]|nr:HD domain-containing protein [Deltaproteobacteria bacterium]